MKQGKLYGVGVGPGDQELITLKAVRVLQEADVIAVPDKGSGEQTALEIIKAYIDGKERISCATPMIRDKKLLDEGYEKIADIICALLDCGKNVAFITLGDPSVYSTYIYVHRKILARGYEAELIPGVPSFCAAAALLNTSLCQGEERLLIVPASHDVDDCFDVPANKVFMKAGRSIPALQEKLHSRGLLDRASVAANCGMSNQRVWSRFADMEDGPGYFAVVLVKQGE